MYLCKKLIKIEKKDILKSQLTSIDRLGNIAQGSLVKTRAVLTAKPCVK
jgi:hypothetical protein